jgi:UDP-glucuronate decarboxylase
MNLTSQDFFSQEIGLNLSKELSNKKILISGGLGLIGLGLLELISYLNKQFDSKISTVLTSSSDKALWMAEKSGAVFEFLEGDIVDRIFVQSLPHADYVIHAAGYGQPGKFLENPIATLMINSAGTLELRKKARQGFLFVSTSEVYSGLNHENILEHEIGITNTDHERASYIEAKRFGEALTLVSDPSLAAIGNVARLALAYGPGARMDDRRVINELIVKGLKSGKVSLLDQGDRQRTYCYISDAAEMLLGALVFGKGEIYNVGGESSLSIRRLGELISKSLGVEFETPTSTGLTDSSPKNVSVSNSKITSLIGKEHFVEIEEGLERTVNWYRKLSRHTS